jgi:hypothetical protein
MNITLNIDKELDNILDQEDIKNQALIKHYISIMFLLWIFNPATVIYIFNYLYILIQLRYKDKKYVSHVQIYYDSDDSD